MEKIENKIKGYLNAVSAITIAFLILGIIFIIFPASSIAIIRWGLTLILMAAGFYLLVLYYSVGGLIMIVLGTLFALYPGVMDIFPILMGIYMIISNFIKISGASSLRNSSIAAFRATIILNIIGLICGVVILVHPSDFNVAFIIIVGITMIIYSVSDLIDMFILRKHISNFSTFFHRAVAKPPKTSPSKEKIVNVSDISEATIVKKKKK